MGSEMCRRDRHNLRQIVAMVREHNGTSAPASAAATAGKPSIIAVVKANAYGHGAAQVALTLEAAGAAMFACADLEEGVALREAGVTRPILVFGALSVGGLSHVFTHAPASYTHSTRPTGGIGWRSGGAGPFNKRKYAQAKSSATT